MHSRCTDWRRPDLEVGAALTRAINQLELGDELSVDNDVSVFCISGKDIDFKG